jgi:hypothetical protein
MFTDKSREHNESNAAINKKTGEDITATDKPVNESKFFISMQYLT